LDANRDTKKEEPVIVATGATHRFNLLPGDAFILELRDDIKIPDDAVLVVEGLKAPFRASVQEHLNQSLAAYRFILRDTVPGSPCSAKLETAAGPRVLFENVDLHAFIDQTMESEEFPPLQVDIPDDIVEHFLEVEDEVVDEETPEGEAGDWDFADEQALEESRISGQPTRAVRFTAASDSEEDN